MASSRPVEVWPDPGTNIESEFDGPWPNENL